jgi:parallel beta-helix repeat protein
MKNLFALFILLLFSVVGKAATYYIDSSITDTNVGSATPDFTTYNPVTFSTTGGSASVYKTLADVNAKTKSAGDNYLFRKGQSWYGSLTLGQSGSAGNPITFGAYGTGANPIISGFTDVTQWTNLGSNIWESTNAVSGLSTLNMVTINGINTPQGREPDSGYYYYQSHSGGTSITSNNLTGTPSWTGAEVALNVNMYWVKRCPITNQSGGTLTFTQVDAFSIAQDNLRFIIQGDLRTLDTQGEWYYNPSTKKISIYSTSQPTGVKVSTVDDLFSNTTSQYITFNGIDWQGANKSAIRFSFNNFTLQNSNIKNIGFDGIFGVQGLERTGILIEDCTFDQCNNGAIGLNTYFQNVTVRRNNISNIGMNYGGYNPLLSGQNDAGFAYGICSKDNTTTIEDNNISNVGYLGINYLGSDVTIQRNYLYNTMMILEDGGAIYTWNNATNANYSNTFVRNNIIINNDANNNIDDDINAGIYLDDKSNGITVINNTISGCDLGIYHHLSRYCTITNNTIYNCDRGLRYYNNSAMDNYYTTTGNIVVAKQNTQSVMFFDPAENFDVGETSVFSNNIYARPIDDNLTIGLLVRDPFNYSHVTLASWKTYSGQDANSTKSPYSISSTSDMRFEYNETATNKTVVLDQNYRDIETLQDHTSYILAPYTSVVLIKHAPYASTANRKVLQHNGKRMMHNGKALKN